MRKESRMNTEQVTTKIDSKEHWDKAYTGRVVEKQGWYETDVSASLNLIKKAGVGPNARILNVGAGSTTLIDALLEYGYNNLLATDISVVALQTLQERIGVMRNRVEWIVDDLTNTTVLNNINPVDLWIDRAVLHFFTKDSEQNSYFKLLRSIVHKYGYVILAQYSMSGARKCSGLPVHRYSVELLQKKLGGEFKLITSFDHDYTMPSGDSRPYIYTLFQRVS